MIWFSVYTISQDYRIELDEKVVKTTAISLDIFNIFELNDNPTDYVYTYRKLYILFRINIEKEDT